MEISHSAQFLQFAFERRFASPAFNVWNLEIGKALVKGLPALPLDVAKMYSVLRQALTLTKLL
jgi:fructose/tagatose bisphosphate aldolase